MAPIPIDTSILARAFGVGKGKSRPDDPDPALLPGTGSETAEAPSNPPMTLCNVVLNQSQGVLDETVPFRICTEGIDDLLAMNMWTVDAWYGSYLSLLMEREYLSAAKSITAVAKRTREVIRKYGYSGPLASTVVSAYLALKAPQESLLDLHPKVVVPREAVVQFARCIDKKDLAGFQEFSSKYGLGLATDSRELPEVYACLSNLCQVRAVLKAMSGSVWGGKTEEPNPWAMVLAGILVNEPDDWTPALVGERYVDEGAKNKGGQLLVIPPRMKYLECCDRLESQNPRKGVLLSLPGQEGFVSIENSEYVDLHSLDVGFVSNVLNGDIPMGRWVQDRFDDLIKQGVFSFQCPDLDRLRLSKRISSLPKDEQVAVASTLYSLARVPCVKGFPGKK